jgi:DNA-binding transcriptional MocR family regulator
MRVDGWRAEDLRAAIVAKKFGPGDKLPSGAELSEHYGVARMTVQQALRLLRDEGLTVSRQGSEDVFFGFYPVTEHTVTIKGTTYPMYDLMDKDAVLFQHSSDAADDAGRQYVKQARLWFDSMGNTVSREYAP